uniref:SGNH hydrolase-type esterase domain-containing protein n=1 Tax=Gouania willdenowi TaxID=441366 RepID=A0A8C5N5D6_GOUWI
MVTCGCCVTFLLFNPFLKSSGQPQCSGQRALKIKCLTKGPTVMSHSRFKLISDPSSTPSPAPVSFFPKCSLTRHGRPKKQPHTLIVGDVSVKDAQKMFSSNVKVICLPNDTVSDLANKILYIVADFPHLKNVVIHFGLNDLAKEESEVLKQDFTHLLKTACGKSIFLSGPLPTLNRGIEQFSRLLQQHNVLQSCCKLHNFTFIDNFDLYWKRADLLKKDGVHPNLHGAQMLKLDIQSVILNSTRS